MSNNIANQATSFWYITLIYVITSYNIVNSFLHICRSTYESRLLLCRSFQARVQHIETGYLFIYIIKDLILKFVEWGELNQTSLMSFCRLNLKKHRSILDGMKANGLIVRRSRWKESNDYLQKPSKRIQFSSEIIEPYEKGCFREQQESR
jgi:hypothetical protein